MVTLANPRTRDIDLYVNSYGSAERFLAGKSQRKLANNTFVRREDEQSISVVLHRTPVVTYYDTGLIVLRNGGYRSKTTAQRINQLLPPGWKLSRWVLTAPDGEKAEFFEGIAIHAGLRTLGKGARPEKNPSRGYSEKHDKDGLVGYIDVAREGEELRDPQGKPMGWRIIHNLRTYRNAEGERSYGVLLINAHRSSRSRYAGGLLLVDGGSLFRGRKFPGMKADEAHDEARSEAEHWTQIDAEDSEREPMEWDDED